jgi:hypothetical protein
MRPSLELAIVWIAWRRWAALSLANCFIAAVSGSSAASSVAQKSDEPNEHNAKSSVGRILRAIILWRSSALREQNYVKHPCAGENRPRS